MQLQALEFAKCLIVFTRFRAAAFAASEVLEWYRLRWQVELVFERFKSLVGLAHLPERGDESARASQCGELVVALLVEKLIDHGAAVSAWGYRLAARAVDQRAAGLLLRAESGPARHRAGLSAAPADR